MLFYLPQIITNLETNKVLRRPSQQHADRVADAEERAAHIINEWREQNGANLSPPRVKFRRTVEWHDSNDRRKRERIEEGTPLSDDLADYSAASLLGTEILLENPNGNTQVLAAPEQPELSLGLLEDEAPDAALVVDNGEQDPVNPARRLVF